MNIDKRKKYRLVVDVETAGDLESPLVYDIGFSVTDKKGNIYESYHFVINEIFFKLPELMQTAYYACKIPLYLEKIEKGEIKVERFINIYYLIRNIMKKYNISDVGAYNCHFDRNALNNTIRFITFDKIKWFFPYGVKFFCIWHMACQVICTQKSYKKFVLKHGIVSAKGNISTSAETVYKYLLTNPSFIEEHMGLDDVKIEVEIMARCFRQHKKMNTDINRLCWRIPQ